MRSIEPDSPTGRVSRDTFEHDLTLTLALLQRGFADTRSVLVKPTSVAALLAPQLLSRSPQSRALGLSMKLRPWRAIMLREPMMGPGLHPPAPVRPAAWHRVTGVRGLRTPSP